MENTKFYIRYSNGYSEEGCLLKPERIELSEEFILRKNVPKDINVINSWVCRNSIGLANNHFVAYTRCSLV